jgi:hypothetical protein
MAEELLQIRVTADFKEAEGAFLRLAKVATSFESNIRTVSASLNKEFNKIVGSAELFGNSTNVVKDKMNALKSAMVSLMSMGFQPMNPEVQKLKVQYDALAASLQKTTKAAASSTTAIQGTAGSAKKSNQQFMNLALVLQDLPYGFRGIQNNLPALLGGIAGVGGAAYLAFSAIIASLTFWDEHNRKVAASSKKLKEEQASLNDEILNSKQNALQQGYLLNQYIEIARNATLSDSTRNEALKQANTLYGEHNQKLTLANINTKAVKESVDGYIQSLIQMAVAQKYSGQVADNIIESDKIKAKIEDKNLIRQKLTAEVRGKQNNESRDLLDVYKDLRRVNKEIYDLELEQGKNVKELTNLTNKYSDSLIKATELGAKFGKVEDTKTPKGPKEKVSKYDEDLAKETFNFYKDNLFQAEHYFNQLNDIEKLNALKEAVINKASNDELTKIEETYAQKSINFQQQIEDKKLAIRQASLKRGEQLTEADNKAKKKVLDTEFQNEMDAIQNKLSAQLKGNRREPLQQAQNYNEAIAGYLLMSMEAGRTAEEIEKLQDKINNLNSSAAGTAAAFTPIADILNNLATNTLVEFGTQIGNLLSGGQFSIDGFLGMIANALIQIGTHLVMISKLFLAVDALFKSKGALAFLSIPIGLAAIAAGVALKSSLSKKQNVKAFASGGIVSGPTMGLIGEYPGAKSNPEVVAPLDKLKDMLGSNGGGQFILKGQDLVLAMNRSESSLKLRRG